MEDANKIILGKGGGQGKLRIIKGNLFELDNGVFNFLGPVFFAGLDHPVRKTMQRDIKDMPSPLKPGRQPPQLDMMLQQENRMARLGKAVGTGQAAETGAITITS